jgi:hypothetical protein
MRAGWACFNIDAVPGGIGTGIHAELPAKTRAATIRRRPVET